MNTPINSAGKNMASEEFIEITGVTPDHLREIVALGWIETYAPNPPALMFQDSDVYRVRQLERICGDFELPVIGGTIIIDLLDRIDKLERRLRDLDNLED